MNMPKDIPDDGLYTSPRPLPFVENRPVASLGIEKPLESKRALEDDITTSSSDVQFNVQLINYRGWEYLEAKLREVPLLGDRSLLPYASAQIRPLICSISDLRPTSLYVMKSKIEQLLKLQIKLQSDCQVSLFDLTGIIEYNQNGCNFRLSPPIVETYNKPEEHRAVMAIIDGLHCIWLARELGLKEVSVIEISDISDKFPLVPRPLNWEDVRKLDYIPATQAKRRFRFPTLESFPNILDLTQIPVTTENFLYFFYRDLSSLGSGGIKSH